MLQHLLTSLALPLMFLRLLNLLPGLFPPTTPACPSTLRPAPKPPRPLRPHTPEDCPACRRTANPSSPTVTALVRPWREGKSPRGRRKTINTDGYACPHPDCKYYHITDANVHALVNYGHHGTRERIQALYCQACHLKFSVRRHTVMYRLKTSAARVALVRTALAEGLSVSAVVHTFGHRERSIIRWLLRSGMHAERLHGRLFPNLQLLEVQLEELRTTLRDKGQEVWIWIACDAKTKGLS